MKKPAPTFKAGDWIFCEFKLQKIEEIRNGQIQGVTDGLFSHGSSSLNDRCFPLDLRIKVISDSFDEQRDRLHREGARNLNFPDIQRWLVEKWVYICRVKDDDKKVNEGITELDKWCSEILKRCKELDLETVGGIRLFR